MCENVMRKIASFKMLGILVFSIIILIILDIAVYPISSFIYLRQTDIDINSGDYRSRKYVCLFLIRDEIQQSFFLREVRRLGLCADGEKRIWKHGFENTLTMHLDYGLGFTFSSCSSLLAILVYNNVPDQDRIPIIQRALQILRDYPGGKESIQDLIREAELLKDKNRNISQ